MSLEFGGSRIKWENGVHEEADKMAHDFKEIAEVLCGDGRWKRDTRHIHVTGKSETVSEYPASLVVAMLRAIKRQMISDSTIRIGEMHFAGPVPDEGDYPHRARRQMESRRHVD